LLEELNVDSLVITGIAADNSVLLTASDAYVRQFSGGFPRTAWQRSENADRVWALAHMKRVLKAQVGAA